MAVMTMAMMAMAGDGDGFGGAQEDVLEMFD
jgi:hypothetical protein